MMSKQLESAFVLHSRDYRNTSVILDLFAKDEGRYSIVVRGARSAKSKLNGRLQPFTPILIASVGRGELKTSTSIDFPARPYHLVGEMLLLGLYINELLYRLLGRFDPAPLLFASYERLLTALQGCSVADGAVHVRAFELTLLQELGYGISFEYDARIGQPVSPEQNYRYVVNEGFVETVEAGAEVFRGSELLSIAAGDLGQVDAKRIRNLTRRSLSELLGDKPLKSRALFKGVAR
jgi:DNA repair protein RecO (recombination protein O)